MVAEHTNGSNPFGGLDANTTDRLLDALADLNLEPADRLPVEMAILLAARLGLTQQELGEAHADLRQRMATETAPEGPRKRFAPKVARGIQAQIEKPQITRPRMERQPAPTPESSVSLEYPEDLYAEDPDSVRARVYRVLRENRVDLRHPIADRTCQAIAFVAETQPGSLRSVFNKIRMDLGISCGRGRGVEAPISIAGGPDLPPAAPSLIDQVGAVVQERGIDLAYLTPDGFIPEMVERFDRSEDSIRGALKALRKRLGVRATGRPLPGSRTRTPEGRVTTRPVVNPAAKYPTPLPPPFFQDEESVLARVYRALERRGVDLRIQIPPTVRRELIRELGLGRESYKGAVRRIREMMADAVDAGEVPHVAPVAPPVVPIGTKPNAPDARALALEIAAELRSVEGEKRAQALIQAGRLVERLLG